MVPIYCSMESNVSKDYFEENFLSIFSDTNLFKILKCQSGKG